MSMVAIIWVGIGVPLIVAVSHCLSLVIGRPLLDIEQVAITATTMAIMNIAHYMNITAENVINIWATFLIVTKNLQIVIRSHKTQLQLEITQFLQLV